MYDNCCTLEKVEVCRKDHFRTKHDAQSDIGWCQMTPFSCKTKPNAKACCATLNSAFMQTKSVTILLRLKTSDLANLSGVSIGRCVLMFCRI